jgi:hypothetical protein
MSNIFGVLSKSLPKNYVNLIEQEYNELKNSYYLEDKTSVGIHSGRFCELISSLLCLKEFNQKDDLNKIKFDPNINKLENAPKNSAKEEVSRLMIPRVLRSIYTIRSKKKIAHIKTFDPVKIDLKFINIAVDWVISQLLIIYCNVNSDEVLKYFERISLDDFRKVERFENGDIVFNAPNLSFKDKLLFILADFYNKGRINQEILLKISKPKNKNYISIYLSQMKSKHLVHIDENGIVLTKWGMEKAREIRKELNV